MFDSSKPVMNGPIARRLARLTGEQRRAILDGLSPEELAALEYRWDFWARPDQLPPPGDWRVWVLQAGRGAGKTKAAAEYVRAEVEAGRRRHIGIAGPTSDSIRRDMVEGVSGLLAIAPDTFKPEYQPSTRTIVWPNGAIAYLLSAEEPERARGPNLDFVWADELGAWGTKAQETWDNLKFALRLPGPKGDPPRIVISTTPKRGALLRSILNAPKTIITRARTSDNIANLDAETVADLIGRYGGTRLGRQELEGELLDDVEGALWTRDTLDACRVSTAPDLTRIVIGIDPAGSSHKGSDETGIIVAGIDRARIGYVLADLSGRFSPDAWARRAIGAYHSWKADRIVAEKNFGGDMVEATLRSIDRRVPIRMVVASRGKAIRAEPIAAFYEQMRIKHLPGLTKLEDQLTEWDPTSSGASPDRLDALTWTMTDLMCGSGGYRIDPAMLARMGIHVPGLTGGSDLDRHNTFGRMQVFR